MADSLNGLFALFSAHTTKPGDENSISWPVNKASIQHGNKFLAFSSVRALLSAVFGIG